MPTRNLVFTICAENYIGLSKVLQQSVELHGADADFRIFVADALGEADPADPTVVRASAALEPIIGAVEYANMAFMYNVTEFCTALKAACFVHGFAQGYDKCVYMDPDIFVTADLGHVMRELEDSAILLTPHLCLPARTEGPRADRGILATGIYNLGFLALRRCDEVTAFLDWWHERLRRQAFNDHYHSLYTDQRWMDFVPSLFSARTVRVWRHLGCNVAPWNYHERAIERHSDGFVVRARVEQDGGGAFPLVFLHFSGFDFRRILDGRFDQLNLAGAEAPADIQPLHELYGRVVRSKAREMARYLALPYLFDQYVDGSPVLPSHRRLFRVWRERHGDASNPFGTGPGSFHAALKARRLLGRAGSADLAADKANSRTILDPEKLLERARALFRLLFRVLGRARFFFLVRSLTKLSHVEQHYDTFGMDEMTIKTASPGQLGAPQ